MALYQSEITHFIKQFFAEHPEEKAKQQQGYLIFWDKKPTDVAENRRILSHTVKPTPDPYRHRYEK